MRQIRSGARRRSRHDRRLRLAGVAALVLAAAAVPMAAGSSARLQVLAPPTGLTSFELLPGDVQSPTPTFSRTPAFAWRPVRGAVRYQVELSTNSGFRAGNGVVWSKNGLTSPVAAIPIALPWMGSDPLYWRVRAFGGNGVSGWSGAEGFRVLTGEAPRRRPSGPGLRQVVGRFRCRRVRGLVPEPREDRDDDHDDRGSPQLLRQERPRQGRLACAGAAPPLGIRRPLPARDVLRPVERDLHDAGQDQEVGTAEDALGWPACERFGRLAQTAARVPVPDRGSRRSASPLRRLRQVVQEAGPEQRDHSRQRVSRRARPSTRCSRAPRPRSTTRRS